MKKLLVTLGALFAVSMIAQAEEGKESKQQIQQEVKKEKQELKEVQQKVVQERQEVNKDREQLKNDKESGASKEKIAEDKAKLKQDKKELKDNIITMIRFIILKYNFICSFTTEKNINDMIEEMKVSDKYKMTDLYYNFFKKYIDFLE